MFLSFRLKGIYLEILVASGEGSRGAGDKASRDTYLLLFPFCSFKVLYHVYVLDLFKKW